MSEGRIKYKHACPLPFTHLAIRPNNQIYPCCQFDYDKTPQDLNLQYQDVFNHPFLNNIREQMQQDLPVEGCQRCYRDEALSQGGQSYRLDSFKEMNCDEIPEQPILKSLDLALSNLCNNKCRMCNPLLSTSWYSDSHELGKDWFPLHQNENILYSQHLLEGHNLSSLRFIKLIGGEPLMEQKKLIHLLKRCQLKDLEIILTTNTTIIPNQELLELLSKCKKITIILSVDAFGHLNNFLRKGSEWNNVVKTMDWFSQNFPNKVKIHSVISIYNINNFYELSEFVSQRYLGKTIHEWVIVDGAQYMHPSHLPREIKNEILENTKPHISERLHKLLKEALIPEGDLSSFKKFDDIMNRIRGEHWKLLNPWLYQRLEPHLESK